MPAFSDLPDAGALDARLERLEKAVDALTHRLDRLEARDHESSLPPLPLSSMPAASHAPNRFTPPPPPPSALPRLPRIDWEGVIGGQGALWVGSAALFLAVSFFLAYAWQFLDLMGRSVAGFLLGMGLIVLGVLSRKRTEGWFGVGLMGAGLAILYLNTGAGFVRGLFESEAAFAMMIATTMAGVVLAVRLGAVSIISLATLGGFMTPVVLGGAPKDPLPLLLYLAVLNTGIVMTSLFKRWTLPVWLSFGGTVLLLLGLFVGLLFVGQMEAHRWEVFGFATLYFAQFLGASCFYSLIRRETTPLVDLFLPCLAALLYALAGYWLILDDLGALRSAFPLALTSLFGLVAWGVAVRAPSNTTFRSATTGLALFFLTLAAPIQLQHSWLAAAWAAEGALLETLGIRFASPLFRRSGQGVFGLYGLALLAAFLTEPSSVPRLVDERGMALGVGVVSMGWLVLWSARWQLAGRALGVYSWLAVAGLAVLIDQEVGRAVWTPHWLDEPLLIVIGLWGLVALGGHRLGARLNVSDLRLASYALAALAIGSLVVLGSSLDVRPVLNVRLVAYGVLTGALLAMASRRARLPERESRLLAFVPLGLAVLGVWELTLETFAAFRNSGIPDWERPAQLGISLVWTLSGVLLLGYGVKSRSRGFRLLALGVLGVTALKVFLFDLASLDTPFRILSFGGLGIVLLGISWLYGRYGLHREG